MERLQSVLLCVAVVVVGAVACAPEPPDAVELAPTEPPAPVVTPGPTVTPIPMLDAPFSPEQIRDEWVVGLSIRLRRLAMDQESAEQWSVVDADENGCDLRFETFTEDGELTGRVVRHSSWVELRDHAVWPASIASRERGSHTTALGTYDGWWYEVYNDQSGTTTRLFFADELPGAPAWMRQTRDGETVMELEQVARSVEHPDS